MNGKPVAVVAAPNIKRPHSHLHLPHQRVALSLERVSPNSGAHAGMRADDGKLADGDAVIKQTHPRSVEVGAALMAVLGVDNKQQQNKTDVRFYHSIIRLRHQLQEYY